MVGNGLATCWPVRSALTKKGSQVHPDIPEPTSLTLHRLHPTQHFYYPSQFGLTNTLCTSYPVE